MPFVAFKTSWASVAWIYLATGLWRSGRQCTESVGSRSLHPGCGPATQCPTTWKLQQQRNGRHWVKCLLGQRARPRVGGSSRSDVDRQMRLLRQPGYARRSWSARSRPSVYANHHRQPVLIQAEQGGPIPKGQGRQVWRVPRQRRRGGSSFRVWDLQPSGSITYVVDHAAVMAWNNWSIDETHFDKTHFAFSMT